ncbi:hexosyltransferase GAUT11-like [Brassica napus]|uniref:hexosyltransferase GAUT11-like n=1 Tax=Brassica napus TaxID=3708 RepID=UPI000BBE1043|nr:hexosyltransferase GAUT11-like [Brassica napus]
MTMLVLEYAEKHDWSEHPFALPGDKFSWIGFVSVVGVTATGEIVLMNHYSNPFYVFYFHPGRNTVRRLEVQGFEHHGGGSRVYAFVDHVDDLTFSMKSWQLPQDIPRFYIPEIYPQLVKIVFLDDDVVVQKDLTSLFSFDLHGDVIGAVGTCLEAFHRYYKYLNFSDPLISSKFDPQACGWASCMNVFDLIAWRNANVTARYHYWHEQNRGRTLRKLGTIPPGRAKYQYHT